MKDDMGIKVGATPTVFLPAPYLVRAQSPTRCARQARRLILCDDGEGGQKNLVLSLRAKRNPAASSSSHCHTQVLIVGVYVGPDSLTDPPNELQSLELIFVHDQMMRSSASAAKGAPMSTFGQAVLIMT